MIPPSSSASDRIDSILGNAEWVKRRSGNDRARKDRHFVGGSGAGATKGTGNVNAGEDSTRSVWTGSVSLTRRNEGETTTTTTTTTGDVAGTTATTTSVELVGDTGGLKTMGSGTLDADGAIAGSAQASDADDNDGPTTTTAAVAVATPGEVGVVGRNRTSPRNRRKLTRIEDLGTLVPQRTITCQLVAQAPPSSANIPGTARGEGFARASAAGNALPEIVHAELVTPDDSDWPEVWDPVALLRLFPLSAHHVVPFQQIQSVLTDHTATEDKKGKPASEAPAAARMNLPDGYVVFIVSDAGLPDIVRDAVESKASKKQSANDAKSTRPLWAIIQSIVPLAAPQPPASVPTPDLKPARGILRGWVSPRKSAPVEKKVEVAPEQVPPQADVVRMPEELSGVHPSADLSTDEEKSLSSAHEITSGVEREGTGMVTPVTSEDTSELTSGTSEVDRVAISIGGDDELDDWLSPPLARRKRKHAGVSSGSGSGSEDGENSDDSFGRATDFAKLKRTATSPTASPSSSEGEDDLVQMAGQHEIPTSAAAIAQVITPEERVPNIPLRGLRYMLLGFELNHPHVVHLIKSLAEEGATYCTDLNNPEEVDLVVVHPPFLQLLSAPQFPVHVADFIRTRHTRFALGLRHLELCLEFKRQLDPRLETAEVFPEGVLVVMDETALIDDEDSLHRIVRLLAQASAASAAAAAAKGIFHYGQDGTRENPPWPWAIKVANSTIQKLMMTKIRMAQKTPDKAWKMESMIKALHAYKHAGDRAGRGARVMGITWEEASHQPVEEPPQAVRDAVKIAARHVSMCRAVFLVSEDPNTLAAAKGHGSILSGSVDDVCEFITHLVREMWAETKAARTGVNVHDSNLRKMLAASVSDPSVSEVRSEACQPASMEIEDEVTGGELKKSVKKVVKFPTMIDDGGKSTRSRGRYSPPPSPTRTNSGRTGDDTSKDTSKTSTGDAPTDGEETAQSPIVSPTKKPWRRH